MSYAFSSRWDVLCSSSRRPRVFLLRQLQIRCGVLKLSFARENTPCRVFELQFKVVLQTLEILRFNAKLCETL